MSAGYALGIDGGGTKTEAVIIDESGKVVGIGRGGGSNTSFISQEEAVGAFKTGIEAALSDAGLRPSDITCAASTFAWSAGPAFEAVGLEVEPAKVPEWRMGFERAGISDYRGVVLVVGTGSTCFSFGDDGKAFHTGGWGALLGDEGSGYDIGLRGIKRGLYGADGRLPETLLTQAAFDYFGVDAIHGVVGRLCGTHIQQSLVAGFSAKVSEAAERHDEAALEIMEEAGETLGELIVFVARHTFAEDDEFPVVLAGGVLNAGGLIVDPIRCVIAPQYPRARVIVGRMKSGEAVARIAWKEYNGRSENC